MIELPSSGWTVAFYSKDSDMTDDDIMIATALAFSLLAWWTLIAWVLLS